MKRIQRRFFDFSQGNVADIATNNASEKLEIREKEGKTSQIVGYSAVFDTKTTIRSWFGDFEEMIAEGAFKRAISEKHNVKALRNHDPDRLLGSLRSGTLILKEDKRGLWMEVDLPDTDLAKETVELIKRGDITGQSFAFMVTGEKWIAGDNDSLDLRVITDLELWDVGPVTYPAYEETTADIRSNSEARLDGLRSITNKEPLVVRDALGELMHPQSLEARTANPELTNTRNELRQIVRQILAEEKPEEKVAPEEVEEPVEVPVEADATTDDAPTEDDPEEKALEQNSFVDKKQLVDVECELAELLNLLD